MTPTSGRRAAAKPQPALSSLDGPASNAELARLCKALGHPARVQIVRHLANRRTCMYGDLASEVPLAQSTVSQHLAVLKSAGLVRGEVEGPRVCYCLDRDVLRRLRDLLSAV